MSSSLALYQRAKQYIPGGVNSPVRSFNAVGGNPIFFSHGSKAYLFDVDGKCYLDYVGSWGALILGHAPESVVAAVQSAAQKGLSFGASIPEEANLAEKINQHMPNLEKIRFVSSGTEATMTAIRLARGYTKRAKILKFNGCYHGHVDSLLVKAGSGVATLGVPDSEGVPEAVAAETLSVDFNNLEQVTQVFMRYGKEIAAVIVEPVAGNMGCILPLSGFLEGLRELCSYYGSLLIFDEVITGFRVALGGAQSVYDIKPDLTTLGKIIGGGMPIGALGGRKEIMDQLAPEGPVYQAGTLSGNPISVAAGLATLQALEEEEFYNELTSKTQKLTEGLIEIATENGIALKAQSIGGLFGLCFSHEPEIYRYQQVDHCNTAAFRNFFHGMLAEGIYLAPSPFESGFVSQAHGENEIKQTLEAAERVFQKMRMLKKTEQAISA